ncbi:hypothetical protein EDB84DRAFT_1596267, partial [Lactarius hengduanensis]
CPPPHLSTSAPAPLLPSCPHRPVRAEGGTRGRPPPLPSPFARKGAHEGTPPRLSASPPPPPSSPSLFAPPRLRGKGAREGATPGPPPFPIRAEGGGGTRAYRPRHLPSPLAAPPCPRGEREGTPPPAPPFPIRAEGVHAGTPPPAPPLLPWAPPHARGMEARRPRPPRTRGHATGGCTRACRLVVPDTSPSRPVRAAWRHAGARHPRPTLPHSRGRGCTRACRPRPSPSLGPRQPVRAGWRHARAPPPVPHPSPFARKGGARGHAAPSPRCPDTSPSRPVRAGNARARHPRLHPPPFARKGCTRARRPRHLPSSLGPRHPMRAGWRYARARRPRPPRTRGHPTLGPTLPHSRGRGRTECMPPRTRRTGAR